MKQSRRVAFCGMTTALAVVVQVLGGWLGHAFYGQEENAEWLRRMRERGEVE